MAVQWGLIKDMPAEIAGSFQQGQKNALAMQSAGQQQQINALKLQSAGQEIQDKNALKRAFQESGGDMSKAKSALMTAGQYKPAMEISKLESEQQKAALDAKKLEIEGHAKQIETLGQIFSSSHDQASHDANLQEAVSMFGEDSIVNVPKVYNPIELGFVIKKAESVKDQRYNELKQIDQKLREQEIKALGGYRQDTLAQGEERIGLQERQVAATEQAALNKATTEKPLTQKQQSMLMGAANTMDAIKEYRTTLDKFSVSDLVSPDAISDVNNKYQNMLMQAKEVFALGALTGPDETILKKIITSPVSFTGSLTSKKALDKQAEDLARLMSKAGKVATMPKEQLLEKLDESTAPTTYKPQGASGEWTVEDYK